MTSKGDTISRARRLIKADKMDSFLTNRFLYSMVLKFAKLYIKRLDDSNRLARYNSLFEVLPGVELMEVSKIEACVDIETCCIFRRTVNRLPAMLEGTYGSKIRSISSIDGTFQVYETTAKIYNQMVKSSTFKYNKNKYFWLNDGYAYFPEMEWELIDIDALWEDDIEQYKCCADNCCVNRIDERTNVPDYLFAEIENGLRQELMGMLQIPSDTVVDNKNVTK